MLIQYEYVLYFSFNFTKDIAMTIWKYPLHQCDSDYSRQSSKNRWHVILFTFTFVLGLVMVQFNNIDIFLTLLICANAKAASAQLVLVKISLSGRRDALRYGTLVPLDVDISFCIEVILPLGPWCLRPALPL